MSERKVDSLDALFHEKAVFVHMGATMTKTQELEVIRSGGIQYKTVEIQKASVRFIDKTAVLLNKIRLVAVVGGDAEYIHQKVGGTMVALRDRGGLERDGQYLVIKRARAEEAKKEVESWLRKIKVLQLSR